MATSADEFRRMLDEQPDPLNKLREDIEREMRAAVKHRERTFSVEITDLPVNAEEPVVEEYLAERWKVSYSSGTNERYLEFTLP